MPLFGSRIDVMVICVLMSLAKMNGSEGAPRSCSLTQFRVQHPNGSSTCEDCPACPAGQEPDHRCGGAISAEDVKNVECRVCEPGKYSPSNDTFSCYPCSVTCPTNQVVVQNCSVTSDKKCGDLKCEQGFYYETSAGDCQECSRCCGDRLDVVEDECVERGMPRDWSCSVHHRHRCQPKTVKYTVGTTQTTPSATTVTETPPSHMVNVTGLLPTTTSSSGTGESAPTKTVKTPTLTVPALLVALFLSLIAATLFLLIFKKCCHRRRTQKNDLTSGTELGILANRDAPRRVRDVTRQGFTLRYPIKSDSSTTLVEANEVKEPLIQGQANTGLKDQMKLSTFVAENYAAFEKVCEALDTPRTGCGHYENVAKHYGVEINTIKSRFEKHPEGPSKALFSWLGAQMPGLTVGGFVRVLESRGISRNDVVTLMYR